MLVGLGWLVAHQCGHRHPHAERDRAGPGPVLCEGWDLFGTIDDPVEYDLLGPVTEGRIQHAVLGVTHVGAVLLAVRALRDRVGASRASRTAWVVGGEVAIPSVTGVLLLIGGGE